MAPDQNRPGPGGRIHSGLEDILPQSFVDMQKCAGDFPKDKKPTSRPRPSSTPYSTLSRSVSSASSMTDSFMLEHWGSSSKVPQIERDGGSSSKQLPPKEEGVPTPISNWAHLSYVKAQRQTLRAELKAQQIAGAEAKRSVTSLRRLAFRMAINISVKEKQIATTARNLVRSRTGHYLEGRDAQKRVDELQRALRIEEGRNKEILEALEKASILTLQYSTPQLETETRPERHFLSPPSTPPMRSNVPDSPISSPKTPIRSSWHDVDLELTPRMATPSEIRTSDSRLIRAKRESDHALAACRSRIEALQNECMKSHQDGKLLEATRQEMEREIRSHQSRIATLERSRASAEEALEATKSHLDEATRSEEGLQQELEAKSKELVEWEMKSGINQRTIEALQKELGELGDRLRTRTSQSTNLESRTASLEGTLQSLNVKLETAQRNEVLLQDRLAEKENLQEVLRQRLEEQSQHVVALEEKIAGHKADATEHLRKIEIGGRVIERLREQLEESQATMKKTANTSAALHEEVARLQHEINDHELNMADQLRTIEARDSVIEQLREQLRNSEAVSKTHEGAMTTLKEEAVQLQSRLRTETDARDILVQELNTMRSEKSNLEDELKGSQASNATIERGVLKLKEEVELVQANLQKETDARDVLVKELEAARAEKAHLEEELQSTQQILRETTSSKTSVEAELKSLRTSYSAVEASLREAQGRICSLEAEDAGNKMMLERLRDEKTMLEADLREARQQLFRLREEVHMRKSEIADMRMARSKLDQKLQISEQKASSLEIELRQTQTDKQENDEQHAIQIQQRDEQLRELEASISNLQSVLASSEQLKVSMREELSRAQDSRNAVELELGKVLQSKADMQRQIDHARSRLSLTEQHRDTLQTKILQLESDLDAGSQRKSHLEDRLATTTHESSLLKLRVSELEEALAGANTARSDAEEALLVAQSDSGASAAEVVKLCGQLEEAHTANKEMQGQFDDIVSSRSRLEWQYRCATDDLTKAEEALSLAHIDGKASAAEIADLRNQIDKTTAAKEDVQKRLGDIITTKTDLQQQLQSARSRLLEVEAEADDLRSQLLTLQEEARELRQLKSQSDGDLKALQASLSELQQNHDSTQSRLLVLQSQIPELESNLASTQEELEAMRQAKIAAEQRHELALKSNTDLDNQLKLALEAKADTDKRLRNFVSSNSQLEEDLDNIRLQMSQGDIATTRLTSRLQDAEGELRTLQQLNNEVAGKLSEAINAHVQSEEDLNACRSHLHTADANNVILTSRLSDAERELETHRLSKEEMQKRLNEALATAAEAEGALLPIRSRLQELEEQNTSASTEISELTKEAVGLREMKQELEHKLEAAQQHIGSLENTMSGTHSLVIELELNKTDLASQLSANTEVLRNLRAAHSELEERYQERSKQADELENDLRAAQARLKAAESDSFDALSKFRSVDKEIALLRDTNVKLEHSEKGLLAHLASVEEDLNAVRDKNASLEAFLERAQADAGDAHLAVEQMEQRFNMFREESQLRLDAVKSSKLKYKHKLDERNNELETLIDENTQLHHHIDEQTRELGSLKKGKGKLIEKLTEKDKYIEEISSSTEKRIRTMNSAYNGLKKEFQDQQAQQRRLNGDHASAAGLEFKLGRKAIEMEKMLHYQDDHLASYTTMEEEIQNLRDDRKAFEQLVSTLEEKIRHLQVLEEDQHPVEITSPTSPRHITIQDDAYYTAPPSPLSDRTMSSIGHGSAQHGRPGTRASTISHEEDPDSWARRIDLVRMQRDEAAGQLQGVTKSRHHLKKTLRDTDMQLHRLEKEARPSKRPHNLLRKKSRPMMPSHVSGAQGADYKAPPTPTHPTTSHGFSFSPRLPLKSRHSAYLSPSTADVRPTTATPERPKTSHSIRNSHSLRSRLSGRLTTSVGDATPKDSRRRWSSGLRHLFHRGS